MAALAGRLADLPHLQAQTRLDGVEQAGLSHPGRPGEQRDLCASWSRSASRPSSLLHRGVDNRVTQRLVVAKNRLGLLQTDQVDFIGHDQGRHALLLGNHQEAVQHPQVWSRLGAGKDQHHLARGWQSTSADIRPVDRGPGGQTCAGAARPARSRRSCRPAGSPAPNRPPPPRRPVRRPFFKRPRSWQTSSPCSVSAVKNPDCERMTKPRMGYGAGVPGRVVPGRAGVPVSGTL